MKIPILAPVVSSQIEAIGHDPETNTLFIKFIHGGRTYSYADFPAEKFERFKNAESLGKFLGAEIKGKHGYTKLPEET